MFGIFSGLVKNSNELNVMRKTCVWLRTCVLRKRREVSGMGERLSASIGGPSAVQLFMFSVQCPIYGKLRRVKATGVALTAHPSLALS